MTHSSTSAPRREQLLYLLTEAAELEHGLMCSYLFASFSLKRSGEGLRDEEAAAVDGWRRSIREVAIQEMLHLALVQNLLLSLGGAPHLQRPNFPVTAGLYPSGLVLQLRRFDPATLDHFIYLERPEDSDLEDGAGYERYVPYARDSSQERRLMASAEDYASVSALYRAVEEGLIALCQTVGEASVFVGDRRAQVDASVLELEGLDAVTDLASARRAIERIVEQGEGSRSAGATSHFDRFRAIDREYRELRARRPDFEPARPVARNLVMHRPLNPEERTHVQAGEAARLLDLANAVYGLMVQLLARFFTAVDDDGPRRVLGDVAIGLMSKAVAPLAELLTKLPATRSLADGHAGLTFALPRSIHALPQRWAAWCLFVERIEELADACETAGAPPAVAVHLRKAAVVLNEARPVRRA